MSDHTPGGFHTPDCEYMRPFTSESRANRRCTCGIVGRLNDPTTQPTDDSISTATRLETLKVAYSAVIAERDAVRLALEQMTPALMSNNATWAIEIRDRALASGAGVGK